MLEKFTCVYVLITCVVADESDDGNAEDVLYVFCMCCMCFARAMTKSGIIVEHESLQF